MPYLGPPPSQTFVAVDYQDLTGVTGSPVKRGFTLDNGVTSANEIEVFVNNVRQEPGVAYTVSGTALTMTGDVETTDDFYVVYQGKAVGTVGPPDASVTTAKLASGAVTRAKMANDLSGTNLAIDTTSSTFKMTDLTSNAFYRTGTFIPVFSSASSTDLHAGVVGTYNYQRGWYERVGDLVHVSFDLQIISSSWTWINGGASGQTLYIANLPFAATSDTGYYSTFTCAYFANLSGWSAGYWMQGLMVSGERFIRPHYAPATSADALLTNHINTITGARMTFSGSYRTDDA